MSSSSSRVVCARFVHPITQPSIHQLLCPAGPFYLTLTGPKDAFPDLNDPTKLAAVKPAVKSALKLDNLYPLDNIQVWLQSEQDFTTPTQMRRLQTTDETVCCALWEVLL